MKPIQINRRNFFRKFLYALVSFQFIYILFRLLKPRKQIKNVDNYFDAGEVSSFDKGKIYPFGTQRLYLHRLPDGGFMALSSRCTHLGCTIGYNTLKQSFECPCHASAFSTNGEVLSPPATRPLDFFPIAFQNNRILIDINNPQRRNKYHQSQVKYI
ncbi:ubiquinol-cytochrome c reductase iron-sulfur subunit [Thermophagus sp. OGC60D27]|uniref:QcrA and Rieske domain-containing protein n=1 Tax=Thermophagus sp. OGC60D27 TaxID=3458415 RepID=UPI00403762B9